MMHERADAQAGPITQGSQTASSRRHQRNLRVLALLVSIGVAVGLCEMILTIGDTLFDIEQCRPLSLSLWAFVPQSPPLSDGIITDDAKGMRYSPERDKMNPQGFRDRDDFSTVERSEAFKILLLGDSFAAGNAAAYDGSWDGFADLLEERLDQTLDAGAIVWNTGVGGIGQKQQLIHIQEFFSILQPELVILAFFEGNDFNDNLFPVGRYYAFEGEGGDWIDRFVLDAGSVRTLSPPEAWLRARGHSYVSDSILLRSRTASLVYRMIYPDRNPCGPVAPPSDDERIIEFERQGRITQSLLQEIRDEVRKRGSSLIVMHIPRVFALSKRTYKHEMALAIYRALAIPFLDMHSRLEKSDYVPLPNGHWNKSGHRKAADALFDFILRMGISTS